MFQKIEKFAFLALIFSIPFQKRTFLFGPTPKGENFFEWGSGFVYFTDFLVLALAVFAAVKFLRTPEQLKKPLHPAGWRGFGLAGPLLLFLGVSFVSLTQADLINVGVYHFFKLAELIFLFFYVAGYVGYPIPHIKQIFWTFIASGVFQSIIAILQFAKQSSLGLEIFHESTLAIHMKGVAHIEADSLFFIRSYGTFPSPNVLAGFLGLCLLFAFYLFVEQWRERKHCFPAHSRSPSGDLRGSGCFAGRSTQLSARTVPKQPSNPPENNTSALVFLKKYLLPLCIFLLSFAFLLTFSRGTIVFFVLVSALFFAGMFLLKQLQMHRKQIKNLAALVVVSWLLVIILAWPEFSSRFASSSFDEPAIQERLFFNEIGLSTIQHDYMRALFGVGIGNFVHNFIQSEPGLPDYLYQPVHNIFILIASETGTFGLFAFVLFIALLFEKFAQFFVSANLCSIQDACYSKHLVYYNLAAIFCFLALIGMYDHYFWTLQQGALMFWVILGLIAYAVYDQSPSKKDERTKACLRLL